MPGSKATAAGFTLIELMVTLAVLTILMIVAIPSFIDFKERTAVRGAGDQLVSFWADAKLEAVKRNQPVSVTIRKSGSLMCMGASTASAGCNCFNASACDVAQYPADSSATAQSDWRGVTMVGQPTLGPTDNDDIGLATIDPKRGYLTDGVDVGGVTVQSPGQKAFRLRLYVDRWARPYLCAPTNSPRILSDYSTRTCAP
jgi:type IV fimbrial biogenesis protein FimT